MDLKEILKGLAPDDYKALMDAFDSITPFYVELDDGMFVGVHTDTINDLETELEAGFFKYGRIRHAKKKSD